MSLLSGLFARPSAAEIVREHGPRVYRHLKRIFGPRADVDDAYQQVFVEVLRALPTFRGEAKLSTWIRRITWNVAYQEMRIAYRAPESVALDDAPVGTGTVAHLESRDALMRWYDAAQTLDAKQRVVVLMYEVEGNTLKEISEALGRPLQTVASQLSAGRAQLLARLEREEHEAETSGRVRSER